MTCSPPTGKCKIVFAMGDLYTKQLKALNKMAPLGTTNSIRVQLPTLSICVSCLLCLITGNLATSQFRNLCGISFGFDI